MFHMCKFSVGLKERFGLGVCILSVGFAVERRTLQPKLAVAFRVVGSK